jgi:photosystem II stability/assembly factor-like uncharacterized protein
MSKNSNTFSGIVKLCLLILLFNGWICIISNAQEKQNYKWSNVAIGGGGYVTGIIAHPTEKNLIYIRTDVGGAYRWNALEQKWIPLTNFLGVDEWNLYGIESIATDPSNSDIVYMACGKYDKKSLLNRKYSAWSWNETEPEPCDVLVSENKGKTWQRTGLNIDIMANRGIYRNAGERLIVDPNDSRFVYFGSRNNGLWMLEKQEDKSVWTQNKHFPGTGKPDIGISFILADKTSSQDGFRCKKIYVGVPGEGVFFTSDGGSHWQLMPGSPIEPMRGVLCENDVLWVTHRSGVSCFEQGNWNDKTPMNVENQYCAIDIHPTNSNIVIAGVRQGLQSPIYITHNRGETWQELSYKRFPDVPWWPESYWAAATSAILFDPHFTGRVWYTDWYGTWMTNNILEEPTVWVTHETGHEEMCVFSVVSSPKGAKLFTCLADNDGTRHTELDKFPLKAFNNPDFQETTSIDFCEKDPDLMARVGSWDWGKRGSGAYSVDNGITWHEFEKLPLPDTLSRHGRISCSASNPGHFIWVPENSSPFLTTDMGKSWTQITTLPSNSVTRFWSYCQPLASDRVNGNRFYFYNHGKFFVSDDGGKMWTKTINLPNQPEWVRVKAVPELENNVWVSLGKDGLFKSANAGIRFEKINTVEYAYLFGFGKNKPGSSNPSVFLMGTLTDGREGIFRSDDLGINWTTINDENNNFGNEPHSITGDRQVYGRVFIGTGGSGVIYGEIKNQQ